MKSDLKFAFVGDGELMQSCQDYVAEHELEKNVFMLGYMDNPIKLLSQVKFLLLTSIYEGTPMCALEAMALGIPIVSTPTDGMCDLIVNGETGYLSAEDAVLTDCLFHIVDDPNLQQRLCENIVKRFNTLNNIESYRNELRKIYDY